MSTKDTVSEEEVALADLIPKEVEEDAVEESVELTGEESPEELKILLKAEQEKVSKRNKSLKKAKDAQHRTQAEKNASDARFDAMEAKLNTITQAKPVEPAQMTEQEAQKWRDGVLDKPEMSIDYTDHKIENLKTTLATFLGTKFDEFEAKIAGLSTATNPQIQQYSAQIAMLKKQPGFSGLTDEQLLPTAQLLGTKVPAPRGTVSGGKVTAKPKPQESLVPAEDRAKLKEAMNLN